MQSYTTGEKSSFGPLSPIIEILLQSLKTLSFISSHHESKNWRCHGLTIVVDEIYVFMPL